MTTVSSSRVKILITIVVVALVGLVFVLDMQRRAAEEELTRLSVRLDQLSGNNKQNEATAKKIIQQVAKLYALPTDTEPTVAQIVNVEALKSKNAFYAKAENGDYLLVTTDRAILYDPDKNIILDVSPVQIQPATAAETPAQ